ncbi:MAG: hypothetical protein O3C26_02105 [Actinomycetota bacterium]|nr:hypothetical protein [Actinomycetota bacterium]
MRSEAADSGIVKSRFWNCISKTSRSIASKRSWYSTLGHFDQGTDRG